MVITFIIALFILLYIIWYRVDNRLGDLGVNPHPTGTGRTAKNTHPISCRILVLYINMVYKLRYYRVKSLKVFKTVQA